MAPLSFANPEFLWLAPLGTGVAWWHLRRRQPALRFSDATLFGPRPGARARLARWGGPALRGVACLLLTLACAGPRRPDLRTQLPAEGIALVVAVDVSGSMAEPDVPWEPGAPPISRLDAARKALALFLRGGTAPDGTRFDPRPGDAVGLVAFAATPQTACPLTLNHSVLLQVADGLEAKSGIDSGTNVGDSLAEALLRLDLVQKSRPRVVILLSDGEHNVSKQEVAADPKPGAERTLKPREAAQLAANLDPPVKVYTIDTGGDPPPTAKPEEAKQRRDGQKALRDVAEMTGGRSFRATSGADLLAAWREISALEKAPEPAPLYRRHFEYYHWCAGAALALLLAAHALDRTLWRTLT